MNTTNIIKKKTNKKGQKTYTTNKRNVDALIKDIMIYENGYGYLNDFDRISILRLIYAIFKRWMNMEVITIFGLYNACQSIYSTIVLDKHLRDNNIQTENFNKTYFATLVYDSVYEEFKRDKIVD